MLEGYKYGKSRDRAISSYAAQAPASTPATTITFVIRSNASSDRTFLAKKYTTPNPAIHPPICQVNLHLLKNKLFESAGSETSSGIANIVETIMARMNRDAKVQNRPQATARSIYTRTAAPIPPKTSAKGTFSKTYGTRIFGKVANPTSATIQKYRVLVVVTTLLLISFQFIF